MAVQIQRGAEVLGYDPDHLDEQQRDEVRSALQDPAQNYGRDFSASRDAAAEALQ